MSKVDIPSDSEVNYRSNTLKATDSERGLAHIGDTWVAKDGKKTVVQGMKLDAIELPGYLSVGKTQSIDFYSGLSGYLKNDESGSTWNNDDSFSGVPLYVVKDKDGKTWAYFKTQWEKIQLMKVNRH